MQGKYHLTERWSFVWLARQTSQQQIVEFRMDPATITMERHWFVLRLRIGAARRSQAERQLACQHLEQGYRQCKYVGCGTDLTFKTLLWRHIGWSALMMDPAPVTSVPSRTEIEQHGSTMHDDDIRRLDIQVEYVPPMHVRQRRTNVDADAQCVRYA